MGFLFNVICNILKYVIIALKTGFRICKTVTGLITRNQGLSYFDNGAKRIIINSPSAMARVVSKLKTRTKVVHKNVS